MQQSTLRKPLSCAGWAILAVVVGLMTGSAFGQTGYWHTSGNQILDANGHVVRVAGINWYGFETTDEVVHGLWAQDYHYILNAIKSNGYNVIRMPMSNQMVETPIIPTNISYHNGSGPINTDLEGLNSLQILDKIVAYAGQIGLHIILDNHRSEAGNGAEGNGLWYTTQYPESAWINDWVSLAQRYLNNSTVIGFDLRNEPHNDQSGGSCWGCGLTLYDWRLAAERGGNAALQVNPSLLIFVEGTDCYNNDCDWWGGNLEGAQTYPVTLNVTHQLVYSAHDYGPNLYQQSWFNGSTTYQSLVAVWTRFWAYLSLNNVAPVWVGEFGTTNNNSDIESTVPGSQGQWFQSIVTFMQSNTAARLDLLGAERGRQLRLARQQLRFDSGQFAEAAIAGEHPIRQWRRRKLSGRAASAHRTRCDGGFVQPNQLDVECGDGPAGVHRDLQRLFQPAGKFPSGSGKPHRQRRGCSQLCEHRFAGFDYLLLHCQSCGFDRRVGQFQPGQCDNAIG